MTESDPLAADRRSARAPREQKEEDMHDDQSRVAPSVPCVEWTGSTAEPLPGVVTPAERPDLLSAVRMILADPYGCSLCDSGKPRNEAKGHQPDCPFEAARAAVAMAELVAADRRSAQPIEEPPRYFVQYGISGAAHDLIQHPNGNVVKWSDVRPILARLADAEADRRSARKPLKESIVEHPLPINLAAHTRCGTVLETAVLAHDVAIYVWCPTCRDLVEDGEIAGGSDGWRLVNGPATAPPTEDEQALLSQARHDRVEVTHRMGVQVIIDEAHHATASRIAEMREQTQGALRAERVAALTSDIEQALNATVSAAQQRRNEDEFLLGCKTDRITRLMADLADARAQLAEWKAKYAAELESACNWMESSDRANKREEKLETQFADARAQIVALQNELKQARQERDDENDSRDPGRAVLPCAGPPPMTAPSDLAALLREWVSAPEIDGYDSSCCWGCGEYKWADDRRGTDPTYPNCQPDCLVRRTREFLDAATKASVLLGHTLQLSCVDASVQRLVDTLTYEAGLIRELCRILIPQP